MAGWEDGDGGPAEVRAEGLRAGDELGRGWEEPGDAQAPTTGPTRSHVEGPGLAGPSLARVWLWAIYPTQISGLG